MLGDLVRYFTKCTYLAIEVRCRNLILNEKVIIDMPVKELVPDRMGKSHSKNCRKQQIIHL